MYIRKYIFWAPSRAKTIQEQLHLVEKQLPNFKIAALFHSPIPGAKKHCKYNTNLFFTNGVFLILSLL